LKLGTLFCKDTSILKYKYRKKNAQNSSGIYQLVCQDCPKMYIGQTRRTFKARYREYSHSFIHSQALVVQDGPLASLFGVPWTYTYTETHGRTPLDEWSAPRNRECIHAIKTNTTNSKYAQHILGPGHCYGRIENTMKIHLAEKTSTCTPLKMFTFTSLIGKVFKLRKYTQMLLTQ
jgi:hypothetical protein